MLNVSHRRLEVFQSLYLFNEIKYLIPTQAGCKNINDQLRGIPSLSTFSFVEKVKKYRGSIFYEFGFTFFQLSENPSVAAFFFPLSRFLCCLDMSENT